jgi:hypothetical protein
MRLESQGGYPAVIRADTIPGWIVIADVDHDDAPALELIRWDDARRWWRRAKRYHAKHKPSLGWPEALWETEEDSQ